MGYLSLPGAVPDYALNSIRRLSNFYTGSNNMKVKKVEIYDEAATFDEHAFAMQVLINNGTVWAFEGSVGREAMALLEAGDCMLPLTRFRDYWGNVIPSRADLKPGTKGTYENVVAAHGKKYAKAFAAAGLN